MQRLCRRPLREFFPFNPELGDRVQRRFVRGRRWPLGHHRRGETLLDRALSRSSRRTARLRAVSGFVVAAILGDRLKTPVGQ